jgi:hypothetical protein
MELADGPSCDGVTPVDHCLDGLVTALDHLLKVVEDGGLDRYDNARLVGFMAAFERFRNRLALIDHRLIGDGEARGLPAALVQPSMRGVLVQVLRLSPAEAARRTSAATACRARTGMFGEPLPAVRPVLAAAQRDGTVSAEQVRIVERSLASVDRAGVDPADIAAGERLLTDFAARFGAKDLTMLAERAVAAINPDGTLADEQWNADRRHLSLRRCRDGMYAGEFRLTATLGAKLSTLIGPLSQPRTDPTPQPHTDPGPGTNPGPGTDPAPVAGDRRSFGQRSHDALEDLCDRVLQAGAVNGIGGTPATVIVTIDYRDLLNRTGHATTTDGTPITTRQLLEMANQAEIIPTVLNQTGAVLNLGRTRRIASSSQTLALIARDHGCSFPSCDRDPQWCERHHITEWINDGPTDLNNLTLLCRYHHHNFANRGWTCQINPDGLPAWTPPHWLDPHQQPLLNTRIHAHLNNLKQHRQQPPARPTNTPPTTSPPRRACG